jgi:hypothetical protein
MRKLLLCAAAFAAISGAAAAETTGSVGVTTTNDEYSNNYDYDVWQIDGSIFHRITGPWAVQGELAFEEADYGTAEDDGQHYAVHGLYAADAFTVGLFVGQGELFNNTEADFYGVEGAYRLADWTFSGSIIDGETGADLDRYRAGAKYFFGDNIAVNANFAMTEYGNSDWDTFDIGGEYRFAGLPITLTGSYLQFDADNGFEVDSWIFGARWNFGTANLREADRTAPIANVDQYLGDVRRWD